MKRHHYLSWITLVAFSLVVFGCSQKKTVCAPVVGTPEHDYQLSEIIKLTPIPVTLTTPQEIEIGGKITVIDKLVNYPLCNDNWRGIVYVDCDVQVASAEFDQEKNPLFFKGCNLNIEPNTVVYVAAHNNTAYYKGCSCHTGEDPLP